ncbi:MAG: NAD(P)-dependent oxidoreductase, partial [Limnochordia bacterium]
RGLIDTYERAKEQNAVPLGLITSQTKLKRDVQKGRILTYDDVELDEQAFIVQLRRLQDTLGVR